MFSICSPYSVGPLQLAYINDNLIDLTSRDLRLGRHISKEPVVLLNAQRCSSNEGKIRVMTGSINIVDERRPFVRPGGVLTVAGNAVRLKRHPA
jgi:hypothetical protein